MVRNRKISVYFLFFTLCCNKHRQYHTILLWNIVTPNQRPQAQWFMFFIFFWPFLDHWDLTDWKMSLVEISRPQRPTEVRLIVEFETCSRGSQFIQICISSIDCDLMKCPRPKIEWDLEKRQNMATKCTLEEWKFKDIKKS